MREQSKASQRRKLDPRFKERWFVGRGIDVGCGPDPMNKEDWPGVTEIVPYDIERGDGDASLLHGIPDASFDFLHASHCFEHMVDLDVSFNNWLRIVKQGGFLIVTVPDEVLYEYGQWPSRFNADHKHSFGLRFEPVIPSTTNLMMFLWKRQVDVELVQLLTYGWRRELAGKDQTLGAAESAVEFVVRKPGKSLV